MRKLPLLLAGVLALALGVAGIAQAVNSKQTMTVKLQKNKAGTKKKPRPVGNFTVDLAIPEIDPADSETPFATTDVVLHFDKNLAFNYKAFPACTEAQAYNGKGKPAAACNKAKVGSGKAQGLALGLTQDLTVTAFNGKPAGSLLLRVKGSTPLDIDSVIVGKLSKDRGQYGNKLSVHVPENLQHPLGGVTATLTRFLTIISGSKMSKGKPYIGLQGCTKGKLQFKGDFTFTDGSVQHPTATAACKK
jgi:hypothetical protein